MMFLGSGTREKLSKKEGQEREERGHTGVFIILVPSYMYY